MNDKLKKIGLILELIAIVRRERVVAQIEVLEMIWKNQNLKFYDDNDDVIYCIDPDDVRQEIINLKNILHKLEQ